MSRLGKKPIAIPDKVKIKIDGAAVLVEGPKGKLSYQLPGGIRAECKEGAICVSRPSDTKVDKSLHGLSRSLIANMIKGVLEGFSKNLEIVGVGYKAQTKGTILEIQLGFTHPVKYEIPKDIKIETPKPNIITVSGIDKAKVGQTAAEIRAVMPPEPYKGKGIRYEGEYVRKKIGKAVTK